TLVLLAAVSGFFWWNGKTGVTTKRDDSQAARGPEKADPPQEEPRPPPTEETKKEPPKEQPPPPVLTWRPFDPVELKPGASRPDALQVDRQNLPGRVRFEVLDSRVSLRLQVRPDDADETRATLRVEAAESAGDEVHRVRLRAAAGNQQREQTVNVTVT